MPIITDPGLVDQDSVERVLTHHQRRGHITRWVHDPDNGPGHVITLRLGDTTTTQSLRETVLVLQGLTSAEHAHTLPARAGSPSRRVLAAIEMTPAREYACVVMTDMRQESLTYAVVTAYLADDGSWQATDGHYDITDMRTAQRVMAERAGLPLATTDLILRQAIRVLLSAPYLMSPGAAGDLLSGAVTRTGKLTVRHGSDGSIAGVTAREHPGGEFRYDIRDLSN